MKKLKGISEFAGCLGCLLILSACATGMRSASLSNDPFSSEIKKELVDSLRQRETVIRSLKGRGVLRHGSALFRQGGEVAFAVRSPLDFRFDGLTDLGIFEYQLVSRGGELTGVWPTKGRYFRGIGSSEELDRFLSVPLSTEKMVGLLLTHLLLEAEGEYRLFSRKGGVLLKGNRSEIRIQVEAGESLPVEVRLFDLEGKTIYRLGYEDFVSEQGISFPRKIRGQGKGSRLEFLVEEIEMNPVLAHEVFEIEIPESYVRVFE